MNLLHRLFRFEDLSPSRDGSYLLRWTLFSGFGWKVYLHKILATDWAREPHDHPKNFISIGLKGRYVEEIYKVRNQYFGGNQFRQKLMVEEEKQFSAPWIRKFPATHIHRLAVAEGEHAWTICIVGKHVRPWGFYKTDGTFVAYLDFMKERFG